MCESTARELGLVTGIRKHGRSSGYEQQTSKGAPQGDKRDDGTSEQRYRSRERDRA